MPITTVHLRHRRPVDYGTAPGSTTISRRARELFKRYGNVVGAAYGDAQPDSEYVLAYSPNDPASASVGLAMSGGAGAVGATINGVTVTATWATSDTNSCGLAAAAINASSNALVQGLVTANNLSTLLTLVSVAAGTEIRICGTRFVATQGVPPQIASDGNVCKFDISGSDTADALALANAINAAPGVSRFIFAVVSTNTVRLFARQWVFSGTATFAWPTAPSTPSNFVDASAASVTVSSTSLAASAFIGIVATQPGLQGNQATIAASGTGVTVINAETRMVLGKGPNSVNQIVIDNC